MAEDFIGVALRKLGEKLENRMKESRLDERFHQEKNNSDRHGDR